MKHLSVYKFDLSKREADIIQHALKALRDDNNFSEEERAEVVKLYTRIAIGDWKK